MTTSNTVELDKNGIALIQDTAVQARRPRVLKDVGGPAHIVHVMDAGGHIHTHTLEPRSRHHVLKSIESVEAFAKRMETGEFGGDVGSIWVSDQGVSLLLDETTRRDVAVLPLNMTPQYLAIRSHRAEQARDQGEFVRFLRIDLAGTLPAEPDLLALVRNVRWRSGHGVDGQIDHGKESMGRQINAEVLGTAAFPETIKLRMLVYDLPGLEYVHVECAVDLLPKTERFRLVPLPLECEHTEQFTLGTIEKRLRDELQVPVYLGAWEASC